MSIAGKLLYHLYYQPKSNRERMKKFGGKSNFLQILASEKEMQQFAMNDLAIRSNFNANGRYKLNFLAGDKLIHQTLFCTYSFFKFLNESESSNFSVNIYSDGSLSSDTITRIKVQFPQIKIVGDSEIRELLRVFLPNTLFPFLNKNLHKFPLFKKLIYTHLNSTGLSTFLDSDMLFINRPVEFLNWLYEDTDKSQSAFCIQDVKRSYGYTDSDIFNITTHSLKHNINSGMYSIYSERMDFHYIEYLVKKFDEELGSHYYIEQLITAIILEKCPKLHVATKSEYIVLPNYEQIKNQIGTLHHYVNESKEFYLKESWRKQLQ